VTAVSEELDAECFAVVSKAESALVRTDDPCMISSRPPMCTCMIYRPAVRRKPKMVLHCSAVSHFRLAGFQSQKLVFHTRVVPVLGRYFKSSEVPFKVGDSRGITQMWKRGETPGLVALVASYCLLYRRRTAGTGSFAILDRWDGAYRVSSAWHWRLGRIWYPCCLLERTTCSEYRISRGSR
jgi:hypothetical protein